MNFKETLENIYNGFQDSQAIGIDGISKEKYNSILDEEIDIIMRKIENESYDFSYYKQKLLIKSIDKTRELSIPTLRDKIVLKYLFTIILDKFSDDIKEIPSLHTMIKDIKTSRDDFECYLKVDIQTFFPTIDHTILLEKLTTKINDAKIISLISKAIKQSTVSLDTPSNQRVKYNNTTGVPQGLSISGVLADIYLAELAQKYNSNENIKFYKFVDDILIFCHEEDVDFLMQELTKDFKEIKLTIHDFKENSHKSSIGNIKERFEFLGYAFEDAKTTVRESSKQKIFTNLSKLFSLYKHKKYKKKEFYMRLNIKITGCVVHGKRYGWIHFFSFINDQELLFVLDRFVEKNCETLNLEYTKVKHFSRAIYEIKNPQSSYIAYDWKSLDKKNILENLEDDIDWY